MIRPSVLLFALLMAAPAVYRYLMDEVDITAVLIRFLIAVPLAALMLGALRFVASGYIKERQRQAANQAAETDKPEPGRPA